MLGIFHLAESSKWLEDKKDVGRNAGKDKPQRRGKAINATNTSMECFILLWFRNDCGVMAGRAHSNLGIHARLWRWCICWLELSGRSGQQLNQFERQKNALTVNPARAVNRKIGHWWLKSIGNSSAKSFHGKQFHDDKIIVKDECFNVIDPWASIYNLLIPTKAVSQNSWNSWSLIGQKKGRTSFWLDLNRLLILIFISQVRVLSARAPTTPACAAFCPASSTGPWYANIGYARTHLSQHLHILKKI